MKTSVIILILLISIYLIYLAISYFLLKPLAYKKASNQIGGKFEISSDPLIWILPILFAFIFWALIYNGIIPKL